MDTYFIEAVERNNYSSVRYALSNELLIDPRGAVFNEMLAYAVGKMEGLFVKDDGKRSERDPSQWDDNFLFTVKNELDKNFSREKLAYYEQVAKQVLKDKAHQLNEEEKVSAKPNDDNHEQQFESRFAGHHKQVYLGVTICGALLTILGTCVPKDTFSKMLKDTMSAVSKDTFSIISKVAITTLGVACIVIGGYKLYNEYKKNNN